MDICGSFNMYIENTKNTTEYGLGKILSINNYPILTENNISINQRNDIEVLKAYIDIYSNEIAKNILPQISGCKIVRISLNLDFFTLGYEDPTGGYDKDCDITYEILNIKDFTGTKKEWKKMMNFKLQRPTEIERN